MLYVGVDYHKRYAQLSVLDDNGAEQANVRLANDFPDVERFFHSLKQPSRVVLEAGWNWGVMYDWLDQLPSVVEIQLAHPLRVRAIAAAKVKTDSIDARTLAHLLRAGLIPCAHIASPRTRRLREMMRQRLFLVRLRTMVKNRIHALLDRHHVPRPPVSDLFGKGGRKYMNQLSLPKPGDSQLKQDLRLLEQLDREIEHTEHWLEKALAGDQRFELLRTVPGLGRILAAVVALEIDEIGRFATPAKLAAYAGLVPSTRASGGAVFHGRLIKQSNKWLRWGLIEAAWIAIRHDAYFRVHYERRRPRKGANTAIVAVARRLLEVIWHVLNEDRPYELRPARVLREAS